MTSSAVLRTMAVSPVVVFLGGPSSVTAQQDPPRWDCCFHLYSAGSNLGWASSLLNYTTIRTRLEPADETTFENLFRAGDHIEAACKTCSKLNPAWFDWANKKQDLADQVAAIRRRPIPVVRGQAAAMIESTYVWADALRVRVFDRRTYEHDTCAEKYFKLGFQLGYAEQSLGIALEWMQTGRSDWTSPFSDANGRLQQSLQVLAEYYMVEGCTDIRDLNLGPRISALVRTSADSRHLQPLYDDLGAVWLSLQQRLQQRCDSGTVPNGFPNAGPWLRAILGGTAFQVVFDATANKFNDAGWRGTGDPMGTLLGGTAYSIVFQNGAFICTGFNEGTGGVGTWTYSNANLNAYEITLWGVVFTFNENGEVFHPTFGLVGHLRR